MKLGLMIYPTNGEAEMAFHRILLHGKGIKQFNKHEKWFISEIGHKILLRTHTDHSAILSHRYDSIWVDDRVNLNEDVAGFRRSLRQFLLDRGNEGCVFSQGYSELSR